jgi:hypothetical protein
MRFDLSDRTEHLLILGAGASVDYNLPVWKDLSSLIREKVNKDIENRYLYKKEILAWVNKVGEENSYDTIDKCITEESVSEEYYEGVEIEKQLFLIMKDIFKESYKENAEGWIRILNESILYNKKQGLESKIAFVNYNYDDVLSKNFLIYTYLHPKLLGYKHRERVDALSPLVIRALYPHGNFFTEKEVGDSSHIYRYIKTMKSHDNEQLDAVACYDSELHVVGKHNLASKIKLYLLGMGGGLEINLGNIELENPVSEIHVTIKDESLKERIVIFLSKRYRIPATEIKIYSTCAELINNCFNN